MGCVGSKPPKVDDGIESPMERIPSKRLSRTTSSSREGAPSVMNRSDSKSSLIRKTSGPIRVYEERTEKSRVNPVDALANFPVITSIPKARERELVASGWPSWLASAAGEAVTGWLPRRADTFEKLDKIGEGTYSNVYKARDLLHGKTVALKRVRFDNVDLESIRFMAREILILRRLDHPNVIKLEGLIASTTSSSLYLIFEYMEHDLTGLASLPGVKFSEQQVKCYMQQLLGGLEHCHNRGILHRDIKGSNLLVDDRGILKIADFGLATFYDRHNSVPLTSRVVTLWYRPPELLLGATHYGVSVDLWSAGCILGELYAGKPIMPGRTEVEQLHKIFRLCGSPSEDYWQKSRLPYSTTYKPQKPYERRVAERFLPEVSAPALALIETLLSLDPASRGTATSALKSEFFTTKPLPCDPSMLPKYPPSKEIDARRRDQEARRRQALESRRDKAVQGSQVPQESESNLSAKVNAEFVSSLQKKKSQPHLKPRSGSRFHPEESTSGPVYDDPNANSRGSREVSKEIFDRLHQRGVYSGPLTWSNAAEKKLKDRPSFSREPPRLSTLSSFGSSRSSSVAQDRYGRVRLLSENKRTGDSLERFPISINDLEGRRDHDWDYYSGNMMDESHKLEEKIRDKKLSLRTYAPENERMHLSGPLLHPSKDLDQMLKEHDRRIQETARRARLEKVRRSKVRAR